jgi:hypothetical protein
MLLPVIIPYSKFMDMERNGLDRLLPLLFWICTLPISGKEQRE